MPIPSMFDRFPNDLLYEVFEYLTTYHILYAFKGLNKRIDTLLGRYDKYDLNFKSSRKSDFDFICQAILPEQVRSLILSDADDTCRQIDLFFSLFYIRKFVNLQSLTLIEITDRDLNKIIIKMNLLSKLSYLSIKLADDIMPYISIPSLKYLSMNNCSMSQLQKILLSTPMLTNLSVHLLADNVFLPTAITTEIRQLKIKLTEKSNITFSDIEMLFPWMMKLKTFTFIAAKGEIFIHGEQWKHLIATYLSQLKEFHFKIHPQIDYPNIQQILASFQTPFWLKENQWFIHCDHHRIPSTVHGALQNIHLYTLPYCDEQFYLSTSTDIVTNTCKDKYSTIKNLYLSLDYYRSEEIAEDYYFSNLDSLTIRVIHNFSSIDRFIDLSQIKHLTLNRGSPISPDDFFSGILVHSTKLESMKLSWSTFEQITRNFLDQQICTLLKKQIKNLNVLDMLPVDDEDTVKPIKILEKIFSTNLEKLNLRMATIDNIRFILHVMPKLYSLKIEYNTTMNDEEVAVWLKQNIPRYYNFTYKIRSTTEERICLLLWISH